jgi:hypothetical protein
MYVGFQDDRSFMLLGNRLALLDKAKAANATVLRVGVRWDDVARSRPASPSNPADPAYNWATLDEFVTNARSRGFEIVATVFGTPGWANSSRGWNYAPARMADFQSFAEALARRYSGTFGGLPDIKMYTVWNEPNTGRFLMPQFNSRGKSVGPAIYAQLFRAASTGLRRGNPSARVAIGTTSPRGRPRYHLKEKDQHYPADFMRKVAKACAGACRFDAVAHHPYPTERSPRVTPAQRVKYPTVVLSNLARYQRDLRSWFKLRRGPRVWITEYGFWSNPPSAIGPSLGSQASYLRHSLRLARKMSFVDMYIWFIFRDDEGAPDVNAFWEGSGGLLSATDGEKPSYVAFREAAAAVRRP